MERDVGGDAGVILFASKLRNECLVVHPCCYSSSTDSSCEAEASTPHGKVADEVPDQGDELKYG